MAVIRHRILGIHQDEQDPNNAHRYFVTECFYVSSPTGCYGELKGPRVVIADKLTREEALSLLKMSD